MLESLQPRSGPPRDEEPPGSGNAAPLLVPLRRILGLEERMTVCFRITADLIPEEEGGYSVYCPELDIYTQGETEEECLANLREAATLHLEELGGQPVLRTVVRRELEVRVGA